MNSTMNSETENPRLQNLILLLDPDPEKGLWYGGLPTCQAVADLSAEEAAWTPNPSTTGRPSAWSFMLHIAYWKYDVRKRLLGNVPTFGRSPDDWPDLPEVTQENWQTDRDFLKAEHDALMSVVRNLDDPKLDQINGEDGRTVYDLLMGIVMHDAYHTGQIQQLKALCRSLGS